MGKNLKYKLNVITDRMNKKRKRLYGSIYQDQYDWVREKINEGKFFNISHAIQEGIKLLQKREK